MTVIQFILGIIVGFILGILFVNRNKPVSWDKFDKLPLELIGFDESVDYEKCIKELETEFNNGLKKRSRFRSRSSSGSAGSD